jgi:excisionase family DNA binding protein
MCIRNEKGVHCVTRPCRRCGHPETWSGDWAACPCDRERGLTLTVREAAGYCCVSRGAIYYWIRTGLLGASRTTGTARIPWVSIKAMRAADHRAFRLQEDIYRPR